MMKEKNAYVTGADRGLGFGFVQVLLERGFRVYAGSYKPELNELAELFRRFPNDLVVLPLDVVDEESVKEAADRIGRECESLNLLINNAGNAEDRSGNILEPMFFDDMLRLYEINALGPLRVTHSVLPLLLAAEWKTLVNISSIAGSIGTVTRINQYGYTMSKAALNMQSKLIHNHLEGQGLRVLAFHPGWMRTHVFGDIERMKNAPFEPLQAAKNIMNVVESPPVAGDDIFLDYEGNRLPW